MLNEKLNLKYISEVKISIYFSRATLAQTGFKAGLAPNDLPN